MNDSKKYKGLAKDTTKTNNDLINQTQSIDLKKEQLINENNANGKLIS